VAEGIRGLIYAGRVLRSVGTFVVAALFVAACGSSGSSDTATAPTAVSEETASESPLEAALGFPSEPGQRQYQLITMQRAADIAIVECMRQAGFFYAVDAAESRFQYGASVGDGSREWIAENGLGITPSVIAALQGNGGQGAAATNLNYVASLTPEESTAYDRALIGDTDPSAAGAEFQPGGCFAQSFTSILDLLGLIQALEPQLDVMNSRMASDPRVREFQATWSACMAPLGHRYDNEDAMADDVYARLLTIELVEIDGVTQVVTPDELDALLAFERQAALDSFGCRESFADQRAQLRYDYEREFLEDNRFRIADLVPPTP